MYERNLERAVGRFKECTGISLCSDLLTNLFGCSSSDLLLGLLFGLIEPVIEGYGSLCIFFYLISQFQAWHLSLPQYVMERRCTDAEFLCYATLFFVITYHPFSEFIQVILFLFFFSWTKIRFSDTFRSISKGSFKNKIS
jgi:hypothetical protein